MSKDNPSNPFELFGEDNEKTVKPFHDELLSLKGSILDLYIGDEAISMTYDECSVRQNSSIFGKLLEVLDRFIIIHCLYLDGSGHIQFGNKVYINAFQIRAMTVLDGKGSLQDISMNVRDANRIRKIIREKGI